MRLENTEMQLVTENAEYLKVDRAFLLAVIEKESAGKFAWNVQGAHLPAIRIEGHYFYRILAKKSPEKLAAAIDQGLANKTAGAVKNPNSYADRYAMLDRMARIDEDAAYRSISVGAGQVMGDHFQLLGYGSAVNMWRDARTPYGQIKQIIRFIEKNPAILSAARGLNFKKFARLYNGPKYKKNRYDTLLKAHYDKWRGLGHTSPPVIETNVWLERIKALGYKDAVAFQTHYGLKPDGIIGSITQETIVAAEAAKAKPVKDAAVVAGGASTVAVGAVTIDQVVKHVEAVKPVVETLAGMNVNTILVIAGAVVVGAVAYGLYKWWKS